MLEKTGNKTCSLCTACRRSTDLNTKLAKEWEEKGVDIREVTDGCSAAPTAWY